MGAIKTKYYSTVTLIVAVTLMTIHSAAAQESFVKELKEGKKIKIAALGTSLTGGTWRWFDVLKEWLDKDFPGQVSYFNEGLGASASSYPPGESGLDKVKVVVKHVPDVVFIEFAVNDSYKPFNISVADSRKNLIIIIETLQTANPDVEIILQTMNVILDMPELNHTESTKRSALPKYLKMYRRVAKEYKLQIIDHYCNWKRFLEKEGREKYIEVVTDGVHPNLEGYRKVLLPELKKQLSYKLND